MQSKRADGDVSVGVVVVLRKQAPPLEGALVEAAGVPVKKNIVFWEVFWDVGRFAAIYTNAIFKHMKA